MISYLFNSYRRNYIEIIKKHTHTHIHIYMYIKKDEVCKNR